MRAISSGQAPQASHAPHLRLTGRLAAAAIATFVLAGCATGHAEGRSANATEAEQNTAGQSAPGDNQIAQASQADFDAWLRDLRSDAMAQGVSSATLERAFSGIRPIPRVIELDRRQPEFTLTFWRYFGNAISEERVQRGRALLREHRELLADVEARYGVQPRYLVAFWGLETNFGDTFGNFPVVGALATLAHDTRRSAFFREELITALKIIESGDIAPERMEGSWAGAMGHLQFMPSTFAAYAVDATGDGRRDIWGSLPDVFASAANFLSQVGWRGDEDWGREVSLPAGFDHSLASIDTRPENWRPLREWAALGVRAASGYELPNSEQSAALILPAGHNGPAFLIHHNYERILRWNRSIFYAIAVGHLADRLTGGAPLSAQPPQGDQRLTNEQVREVQRLLMNLGYDAGGVDGRLGPRTRTAIRSFQRGQGLPQDAFADPNLLALLRSAAGQ
ncbi:lytic murein transglycosylase [Aquibaculum sediminis]|uniref:lytic murein transglycosylase n=1 Tax=Aquibaculum sediminis TaxID=3231907 RepID=UPI0034561E2C